MSKDFDRKMAIHYRTANVDEIKERVQEYGNPYLVAKLAELGVGATVVAGKDSYNDDCSAVRARGLQMLSDGRLTVDALEQETQLGGGGMEVIRARVLTPAQVENYTTVLNGAKLRKFGASKWKQYKVARQYMPRTIIVRASEEATGEIVDGLRGDKVVLKGDSSRASRDLAIANKADWLARFAKIRHDLDIKNAKNKDIVVQEYAPGVQWQGLRGRAANDRELLAKFPNQELRVYCFVDDTPYVDLSRRHYATARVFDESFETGDEWAYVDQDSVPPEAWRIAEEVSKEVLERTNTRAGYFAIDLFKNADDRIMIREINTRDPMLVGMGENAEVAKAQRRRMAELISRVARSKRG
jgi:hypothetical protein